MASNNDKNTLNIFSPLNGKIVPLKDVPDSVFSEKMLGDGCAIIPNDGKIYSPVNGRFSSVIDSHHAYGFVSDEGVEVLVHFEVLEYLQCHFCTHRVGVVCVVQYCYSACTLH